jgi:hypothetical protein
LHPCYSLYHGNPFHLSHPSCKVSWMVCLFQQSAQSWSISKPAIMDIPQALQAQRNDRWDGS